MKAAALPVCLLLFAAGQDPPQEEMTIHGPPAVFSGGEARFRVALPRLPENAEVLWHFADSPSWIETDPPMDKNRKTITGATSVRLKVGTRAGEGRFTVSIVRGGRRLLQKPFRFRVVEPIEVRVLFRRVRNEKGGTRCSALQRYAGLWPLFVAFTNAVYAQAGIRLRYGTGKEVRAPDWWFDGKGVFHPVRRDYQKRAKTKQLNAMFRKNLPGAVNVYLVRDCHWTERVSRGFRSRYIEHPLWGIGIEMQGIVMDDKGGAITVVHEMGHVLGLNDLEDPSCRNRLMMSVRKHARGVEITYEEMDKLRSTAQKLVRIHDKRR